MNDLFAMGPRQRLDVQCSGLSAAWQRAAQDAARHPPSARGAPAVSRVSVRRVRQFAGVFAIAVLSAALVAAWVAVPTGDVAVVAAPNASADLLAAAQ
jgi:hypothetical protein